MALKKEIELENGIVLNYHRIVSLNKITNQCNIIEVGSYISAKQRQKEIEYNESTQENKSMDVFIHADYIRTNYNENMTIEDAYEYLKTTDKYEDAEDI